MNIIPEVDKIVDEDDISIDDLGMQHVSEMSLEESLDVLLNSPNQTKANSIDNGTGTTGTCAYNGSGTGFFSGRISPNSKPSAFHAVHMEVQENAKIPNTYHVPIRRNPTATHAESRSKGVNGRAGSDSFMDEIMRLTEADLELTETFLGSDHRIGKAAAYNNAGALMSSIGTKVSEICALDPYESTQSTGPKSNEGNGNDSSDIDTKQGVSNNLKGEPSRIVRVVQQPPSRLYGRPIPLPIPTRAVNSPFLPGSSQADTQKSRNIPLVTSAPTCIPAASIASRPSITAPTRNATRKYVPKNASNQPKVTLKSTYQSKLPPYRNQHAILLPPSLLEASKKRSQFGFGGNHKVPSIPLPPRPRTQQQIQTITQTQQQINTQTQTRKVVKAPINTPLPILSQISPDDAKNKTAPVAEGAFYERKQQRAKDARVKLNESIERLAVAISLAGTQSKERVKNHKKRVAVNGNSNANVSTNIQSNTTNTVSIEELVGKTADSAKKWDRPSFVGTAASMVQHLNAECEALMREIVHLEKENSELVNSQCGSYVCGKRKDHNASNSVSDSGSFDDADKAGQEHDNIRKRRKIEYIEIVNIFSIFQYEHLSTLIGSFLDPQSIIRATSVSRSWQYRLACMRSDEVWSSLCVKRYGCVQVMEWQDQLNAEDLVTQWPHHEPGRTFALNLYRRMSKANVRPKCHYEGSCHIGGGRIGNSVSAWASLVERSNGETRRSVVTCRGGDIKYASLPVVELRIFIQNIGVADNSVTIPEQIISIDASTKRSRGAEMFEITSDERFKKNLMNLDGSKHEMDTTTKNNTGIATLAELGIFESTILCTFIHATSCPTLKKFRAKAKYVKVLVNVRGITVPLVIPVNP